MSDTNLKVSDLESLLPRSSVQALQVRFENVEITPEGDTIVVTEDHFAEEQEPAKHEFPLDEVAERELSRFLKIPFKYIQECPGELKATNLNFWLGKQADSEATFLHHGDDLEAVIPPDRIVLPVRRVAGVVTEVFAPEDTINGYHFDQKVFQLDVTTEEHQIDVPGNGLGDRPARDAQVGDITSAGVRLFVPGDLKEKKPTLTAFFHRLICLNGMTLPNTLQEIKLKGSTVDDVIMEMEEKAQELLGTLDQHLESYKQTAEMAIPGNVLAFIRQVGLEHGIPLRTIDRAMDYAAIHGRDDWSLFDVIQLFTALAGTARFSTANRLQAFGGYMITNAERVLERCASCERPLPTHVH